MEPIGFYFAKATGIFYLVFSLAFGCFVLYMLPMGKTTGWFIAMPLFAGSLFLCAAWIWKKWVGPALKDEVAVRLDGQGISGKLVKLNLKWNEVQDVVFLPAKNTPGSIGISLKHPELFVTARWSEKERKFMERCFKYRGVHLALSLSMIKAKPDDVQQSFQQFFIFYGGI